MIKANFEVGWQRIECTEETPSEAFLGIEQVQDIQCLIMQAGMFGDREKGHKLASEFYEPAQKGELTLEKLRTLDIKFAPGHIKCISAEETEE